MKSDDVRDEAEIRQLVATWMAATQTGDVDKVLSLMTEDVVFLVAGREPMRKAEFAQIQRSMGGMKVEGTSDIKEIKVAGDWAFMWTHLKVEAHPPNAQPVARAGHTLTVLRKENGRWRLARDA